MHQSRERARVISDSHDDWLRATRGTSLPFTPGRAYARVMRQILPRWCFVKVCWQRKSASWYMP